MSDVESIFETALKQAASDTAASRNCTMPKAGYGSIVALLPVRAGSTIIAETKEGTGYVNLHINLTMEQFQAIKTILVDAGAEIGSKSSPNRAGFVSRSITVKSDNSNNDF